MLEPVADLRRRQHAGARGGELERQRQAAQPLGDGTHGRHRLVVEHEAGAMLARAIHEQRDPGVGLQRRHGVTALPADPQELAARDDEPERGRVAGQARDDLGAPWEQLLEVVEDEQAGPVPQVRAQRVLDGLLGRLADAEGGGDGGLDPRRIADRGEVDEPRPVREGVARVAGDREREAGLAAAARPGQGHDAAPAELVADRRALPVAPDEARDLARQVRRHLGRAERPGVLGGARHDEAVDRERVLEVLDGAQPIGHQSDVAEPRQGREIGGQRGDDRLRQHDLSAVRGGRDPCRVVHVDPDVVLGVARGPAVAQPALADVDAHPDPHRHAVRPRLPGEGALCDGGGRDGVDGARERREEGVALGLDDHAAVRLDRRAEEGVVPRHDRRPRRGPHRPFGPRRPLDVGEQEGDGRTGRERHEAAIISARRRARRASPREGRLRSPLLSSRAERCPSG